MLLPLFTEYIKQKKLEAFLKNISREREKSLHNGNFMFQKQLTYTNFLYANYVKVFTYSFPLLFTKRKICFLHCSLFFYSILYRMKGISWVYVSNNNHLKLSINKQMLLHTPENWHICVKSISALDFRIKTKRIYCQQKTFSNTYFYRWKIKRKIRMYKHTNDWNILIWLCH